MITPDRIAVEKLDGTLVSERRAPKGSFAGPSVGLITAQNLLRGRFSGPVCFVNPKHATVAGHACYPSVGALPLGLGKEVGE
jgi:acetyltransferase